jgi:hypothetical protein
VAIEQRALGELTKLEPSARAVGGYRRVLGYSRIMLHRALALSRIAKAGTSDRALSLKAPVKGQLRLLVAASRAGLGSCYPVD